MTESSPPGARASRRPCDRLVPPPVRPALAGVVILGATAMLVLAGLSFAQEPPPSTVVDGFDATADLSRIASTFFPAAGASPTVTRVRQFERFSEGSRYETYEVRDRAKTVGRMVRIQVFPDVRSRIDFAVRLDGAKIAAMAPVRPVVFRGRPFPALPALFAALARRPVSSYAGGLATVFHGLALAGEGAAGPAPQRPKPSPGASPGPPLVSISQPSLAPGQPMPRFSGRDLSGKEVTSERFAGRPTVVVIARLPEGRSRESLGFVARETARHPEVAFVPVLVNTARDLERYRPIFSAAAAVYPAAVLDSGGEIMRSFLTPSPPYIYVFDSTGKLAFKTFWRGVDAFARELAPIVAKPRR